MRRGLVLVLVAVAALGLAASALARQSFDSKVTISYDDGKPKRVADFFGKVKSDKAVCIADRKVTLFGGANENNATKVDSYTTSENGVWSVEETFDENVYFAKVKARDISAGHCKGDQSKVLEELG